MKDFNQIFSGAIELKDALVHAKEMELMFINNGVTIFFVLTHWGRVMYMRQQTNHHLVQIMACRLLSAKPLFESMQEYC